MNAQNISLKESRNRLSNVRVMVADRNARTASLVHSVLFSFGFQKIQLFTRAEEALNTLRTSPFDLMITEWELAGSDGIELVKAIRQAKNELLLRRDIPIIMLTAKAELAAVHAARDAGITEFLVKPFTAATLSHRLVQVIDNPRIFIDAPNYTGPDRRRREGPPDTGERRGAEASTPSEAPSDHTTLPPNRELQKKIGEDVKGDQLFTPRLIETAQKDLQKKEGAFLDWAKQDVESLEKSFAELRRNPQSREAYNALMQAAYTIKSQAGIFGYHLGTQVAGNLVEYMEKSPKLNNEGLTVLRKHIDTIAVIFHQKIKEPTSGVGRDLLSALQKLVSRF
jgi:two-component system chemotaxis response regulator CheY